MANKFKIGQKVRAKPSLVDWFSSHLCWSYGRPVTDKNAGYSEGEKEIGIEDLDTVYFWIRAKLSGQMPVGSICNYGSNEKKSDLSCKVDRDYVWVDFKFKTEFGEFTDGTYVSEKDLEPVKTKSHKRSVR